MQYVKYGAHNSPTIILLHGGGLSWWNYREVAQLLADKYHGSSVYALGGLLPRRQHCVLVEATVRELPTNDTGFFGFHIHTGDSCTGDDFADTLGHYNPAETPHPSHAGDLPPLMSCHGDAYLAVTTGRFRINDILGRTVVIHNMPDDFTSQPAGNAGTKIACGVIRSSNC